ncbi:NERD domain-containing protein [Priestia flexa]|uniref:NERD domain-containing protein n=1 Tax=Priestia flexa TaxID=86664 RepID=UPI00248FA4F7|nr:NERD domain-containing protein [Priestia flexa]
MIADIRGKISRLGSNLTERLEDNLTGNVFGVLRYMPFSPIMGEILVNAVYPKSIGEDIRDIQYGFWADKVQFWPYDREGEIDILIEFENMIIGIEVKYTSGLSSDDDISNNEDAEFKTKEEMKTSINQLARESRIISQKGNNKKKVLLFVADRESCKEVYTDIQKRNIIESKVAFGYISWQDFLLQLKKLKVTDPYHQVIINDVIALLTRKGFEDFTNMNIEVPQPINVEQYFQFNIESKLKISFQTDISIKGGLYYEFS